MGIGEHHALVRQFIEMRRWDLRVRIVGADVTVAHVVDQDYENVGLFSGQRNGRQSGRENQG
jgi:hypothetical protein